MTESRRTTLGERLPGLQLAFFEIIWDTFRWIRSIWIKEVNDQYQIFVEASAPQDQKEWDDFGYLVERVFNVGEDHKIRHTLQHGSTVPKYCGYQELMSDRIFKEIAKKHAPWRLKEGR